MKIFTIFLFLLPSAFARVDLLSSAITMENFESAVCKSSSAPSMEEVDNYLSQIGEDSDIFNTAYTDLILNAPMRQFKRKGSCQKPMCIVEKIWGSELGKKLLYMKLKYGFNGSEYAFKDTARFTIQGIDQVLIALGDLPANIINQVTLGNKRLVPVRKNSEKSEGRIANTAIKLYARWKNDLHLPFYAQYPIIHEIGHLVSRIHDRAHASKEFRSLYKIKRCQVSSYGKSSPDEDFAETFAFYRYSGPLLKEICPEKYQYMKEQHFGGVEFLSNDQCPNKEL